MKSLHLKAIIMSFSLSFPFITCAEPFAGYDYGPSAYGNGVHMAQVGYLFKTNEKLKFGLQSGLYTTFKPFSGVNVETLSEVSVHYRGLRLHGVARYQLFKHFSASILTGLNVSFHDYHYEYSVPEDIVFQAGAAVDFGFSLELSTPTPLYVNYQLFYTPGQGDIDHSTHGYLGVRYYFNV